MLVFLRGLRQRKQALVRVGRSALGLRLLDQLVVAEEGLDRLLLAVQLVLQDLDLGLQLHAVVPKLIVKHLHLDGLIVQLLLLLRLETILSRFGLRRPVRMRQSGWESRTHHRVVRIGAVPRAEAIGGPKCVQDIFAGHFRFHILSVQAVGVLVDVGSIRWVEAEPISMRPRGSAELSEVDGGLRLEGCVQVVSRAERAALTIGICVDCPGSLCALREIVQRLRRIRSLVTLYQLLWRYLRYELLLLRYEMYLRCLVAASHKLSLRAVAEGKALIVIQVDSAHT